MVDRKYLRNYSDAKRRELVPQWTENTFSGCVDAVPF